MTLSSHPMAAALVEYGESKGVQPKPEDVEEFQIFPGEGISGEIGGKNIFVGNKRIAVRAGCKTVPSLEESKAAGSTIGYVLDGPRAVGIFSLSDTIRTGVSQAIDKLKSLGIRTAVLTGDSVAAAIHVQEQLKHAIGAVHAELLPEDKMKIIKELKREGPTAMVGDGMNDAPALATADIGISMGISGSAVATETGHITLMSNDIRRIPQSIRLAKTTRRKIFQNVAFSIITKLAILIVAFTGHPIIWAAVLSDVGTCLLVISNSMLVLRGGKEKEAGCSRLSENQSNGPPGCCRGEGACGADDRPPADKPRQCCLNGCQSSLPNENKEIVESNSSCGTRSCRGSSKPDSNGCQSGLCTGEKEMVESDSCQARSCCGGSKDMMPSSNGCQSSLCTGEKVGKEVVEADSSSKSRCCRGNSNMPSLNGCCSGEKVEKEIVESDSCPARSCCGGSSLIPSSNGCQSSLCSGEKVEKEIVEADSCRARSCCGSSKDIMPSSLCCEEKVEKEIVEADSCQARSCCGSSKDIMPSSLCCGEKVEKEIAEADSCRSLSCCASPKDITPSSLCRGEKVEKEIAEADSCGSRSCCGSSKDIMPSSLCCEEKVEKEIVEADSCRARSCCESSKDMMMPGSNGCQSSVCSGENFGKEIIESDSCQSRSCCGASASKDIMPSSDGCQSNLCGGEKVIIESDSCRAGSCCGSSKDMLPSSNGCQSTLRSGEKVEKEIVESDSCRVPSCCGSSKDIIPSLSIGCQSSPCTGDKELVESDICCGSSKAMMPCSDGRQSSLCSGEKESVRPDSGGARSCCGNSKDKMPQTPAVHSHSTCGEPGHVDGGDGSHASGEGHHHVISILGESDGPDHKLGHCRRVECQVEVRPSRSCCSRGDGAHVLKHACAAAVCMAHGSKMGHQEGADVGEFRARLRALLVTAQPT
ncbi:cadmium zinc-transporting ATPase [Asimina triloba]